MYENVCYDNSFLKAVIARVDFAAPVDSLGRSMPPTIGNVAIKHFPISERTPTQMEELTVSGGNINRKKEEFFQWTYYGINREKRLVVTPGFIFVEYLRYSTFEQLKKDFLSVLKAVFTQCRDLRGGRFGLRYINKIELRDAHPLEWDNYISEGLLGLFDKFRGRQEHLTRLFNIVEFRYNDDMRLKFQFGVPNQDYPAPVRRPQFVLDLDGFTEGLQELADVEESIEVAHQRIQQLFEESITTKLREIMRAEQ